MSVPQGSSRFSYTIRAAREIRKREVVVHQGLLPLTVVVSADKAWVGYLVPTEAHFVLARYAACQRVREMFREARREMGLPV